MIKSLIRSAIGQKFVTAGLARGGDAKIVVLCYHDLRRDDDIESWTRVSRSNFVAHLRALSAVATFIGLDELLTPSKLPPGHLYLLVTFDDGYRNNRALAAEALTDLNVPAVFFISTEHLLSSDPFWWDWIVTPIQMLHINDVDLRAFGLGKYKISTHGGSKRWSGIDRILRDVKARGNEDHPDNGRLLTYFRQEYGALIREQMREYAPLTEQDIAAMASLPTVEFGSHGHRHDIMTYIDDAAVQQSLSSSSRILKQHTARHPRAFAYPNGNHDPRVADLVQRAGFALAFGTSPDLVDVRSSPFTIPRLLVSGYDTPTNLLFNINRLVFHPRLRRTDVGRGPREPEV